MSALPSDTLGLSTTLLYGGAGVVVLSAGAQWLARRRAERAVRNVPGPPSPSWVYGHMLELQIPSNYGDVEYQWLKEYGPVYRLKNCFGQDRLMLSDPLAMQFVFQNRDFQHGPTFRHAIYLMEGGWSLSYLEGEEHKHLRTQFNIGMSAPAVRRYEHLLTSLGHQMAEQLEVSIEASPTLDVWPFLGNTTLSALTQVLFGMSAQDLGKDITDSFAYITNAASNLSARDILSDAIITRFPAWLLVASSWLPSTALTMLRRTRTLVNGLGARLLREKAEVARGGGSIDKDIYGLLLDAGVLTPEQIAGQTSLLFIAGQDTTANAIGFALYELARNPEMQSQLRREIDKSFATEAADANHNYEGMPLSNGVLKEAIRLYPALPLSERIAVRDTAIPLKKSITGLDGTLMTSIPVRKGQTVFVANAAYNRMESRWGKDAHEFNPERWMDGGNVKHVQNDGAVGPYANIASFIGGPRTCLGWRLAILEMQVFLCELVRKFSFALPEEAKTVNAAVMITLVPTLPDGRRGLSLSVSRVN